VVADSVTSLVPVFFWVNFAMSQSSNDPQEDLAKFGYKLNKKGKKFRTSFFYIFVFHT
jgi:hypothetical protein